MKEKLAEIEDPLISRGTQHYSTRSRYCIYSDSLQNIFFIDVAKSNGESSCMMRVDLSETLQVHERSCLDELKFSLTEKQKRSIDRIKRYVMTDL